jgi:hypothetical protein
MQKQQYINRAGVKRFRPIATEKKNVESYI